MSRNEPSVPARIATGSPTLSGKYAPISFWAHTWPLSSVTTSSPRARFSMPVTVALIFFGGLSA